MEQENQNPDLEQEINSEEEEVETEDEVSEEESAESEEEAEDKTDEEKEELRQENAKLKRLLNKKDKEKSQKPKPQVDEEDDIYQTVEGLKLSETKRQFGHEHGLSPDEVDKVFQIDPNPTAKTLKDPFVKAGLTAVRKQKRVDENTPSSTSKAPPFAQKSFNEASSQEKDAAWQKYIASKAK